MKFSSAVFAAVSFASAAYAQVGPWQQCGGINQAPVACVSGHSCVKINDYYFQCQPGNNGVNPTPTPTQQPTGGNNGGTPTTSTPRPSGTGKQIRGVKAPIYHLYLQENDDGTPVMGPVGSSDYFIISGSIQNSRTGNYLNIQDASTSYKPIKFEETVSTTGWTLEGDTITTANGSKWGRQLNFLACSTSTSGQYQIYLQTGSEMPSGQQCTLQSIHLPCLC